MGYNMLRILMVAIKLLSVANKPVFLTELQIGVLLAIFASKKK
jgi:hypothetical protein